MTKLQDMPGLKFGMWTVLETAERDAQGRAQSLCQCDCGTIKVIRDNSLKRGTSLCCGCIPKSKPRVSLFTRTSNDIYAKYRCMARKRKIEFGLSRKDFLGLIFEPCFYCGCSPDNTRKSDRDPNYLLKYNGLDRLDNDLGYTKDNCVASCSICNYMKRTQSYSEFMDKINQIINYQNREDNYGQTTPD